jgi:hypothetical protein
MLNAIALVPEIFERAHNPQSVFPRREIQASVPAARRQPRVTDASRAAFHDKE